jgi:hypothetical protein
MASMSGDSWVKAPGNPAADRWSTWQSSRKILVVMPHLSAADRLRDLLPTFKGDQRVQLLWTVPDDTDYWAEPSGLLERTGILRLPWHQAIRTRFDLALCASFQGIHQVQAPVVVVPHGAGAVKSRFSPWATNDGTYPANGLDREIMIRDGRIVPSVVVLTHDSEVALLQESGPEIASRGVIVGDPCFDRLRKSMPLRDRYRRELGVTASRKLVIASTTWSSHSLMGTNMAFFEAIMSELPSNEYRVIAIVHPLVWSMHGVWQVRSWLAGAIERGMGLVSMGDDWRGVLAAADYVLGDHGTVTQYGAALGIPVLMNIASDNDIRTDSIAACLRLESTPLNVDSPIFPQLQRAAAEHVSERAEHMSKRITSRPDQAAVILRRTLYRLLRLSEPTDAVQIRPVPIPAANIWNDNRCEMM